MDEELDRKTFHEMTNTITNMTHIGCLLTTSSKLKKHEVDDLKSSVDYFNLDECGRKIQSAQESYNSFHNTDIDLDQIQGQLNQCLKQLSDVEQQGISMKGKLDDLKTKLGINDL